MALQWRTPSPFFSLFLSEAGAAPCLRVWDHWPCESHSAEALFRHNLLGVTRSERLRSTGPSTTHPYQWCDCVSGSHDPDSRGRMVRKHHPRGDGPDSQFPLSSELWPSWVVFYKKWQGGTNGFLSRDFGHGFLTLRICCYASTCSLARSPSRQCGTAITGRLASAGEMVGGREEKTCHVLLYRPFEALLTLKWIDSREIK